MAANYSSRVVINRKTMHAIELGVADGCFDWAEKVVHGAPVPDPSPFRQGLIESGAAVAWVGKKKVAGSLVGGRQVSKPRSLRLKATEVTAVGGWGFPAWFVHNGSIHNRAKPFALISMLAHMPELVPTVEAALTRRLAGVK